MLERAYFNHVVLQPTTLCNLNCDYCYLPDRQSKQKMPVEVAEAVAQGIEAVDHPVSIVWHGGEPMAAGIEHFQKLLQPFDDLARRGRVSHSIQTNATLLTDEWCDLVKESGVKVGVSIDGPELQTSARKNWAGKNAFPDIMQGIALLRHRGIQFSVIAVINQHNIGNPEEFYRFFAEDVACRTLSVNVEETEGMNVRNPAVDGESVRDFWRRLWMSWIQNPRMKIREFNLALGWLTSEDRLMAGEKYVRNFWPTVSVDGDVVVLSPEFHALPREERAKFVVGNVLNEPLLNIMSGSINAWYVQDFDRGLQACQQSCVYFGFCRGGQASNKYLELGDISGTETAQCRNSRQYVLDTALEMLNNKRKGGETSAN